MGKKQETAFVSPRSLSDARKFCKMYCPEAQAYVRSHIQDSDGQTATALARALELEQLFLLRRLYEAGLLKKKEDADG